LPPKNIKTVRDLVYWEYAKLISGSAVGNRKNYGFVMHTFKKLKDRQIKNENMENIKEIVKLKERLNKIEEIFQNHFL